MALPPPITPMLAEARPVLPRDVALPGGLVYEQKPDGYRALLFAGPDRAHLQSRNGSDLTPAFPEIAAAGRGLPGPFVLDGELVVAYDGRLHFGELQRRARRRGAGARQAAAEHPASLILFDVLDTAEGPLLDRPYRERRGRLEELFADGLLAPPFVLCPATTDRATAEGWLDPAWGAAGIEGVVVKGLLQRYEPGRRGWIKVRTRATTEAVVASVTGPVAMPSTLLLGRYDHIGRLRYVARTAPLARAARQELGQRLEPGGEGHPWIGRRLSAGWGSREELDHRPVVPNLVVEIAADTAVDEGRYRHPVRYLRVRDDMTPEQAPWFDE
ncbi:ATP-dependent DNA ligase [Streptomyces dubilierae]|uniref:DNA ligase (ATP) n=1 Tax=Streptomyces dubilierae TaxID=3075533 RepID=A0ABU2P6S5_9ACTN|nr:ATP-dependent DNA ligase [Streptomyces sp. DSM 41921]MDT0387849.1 ATP-dependent DNA ligase [Streptomyces sp. DSM 41921]